MTIAINFRLSFARSKTHNPGFAALKELSEDQAGPSKPRDHDVSDEGDGEDSDGEFGVGVGDEDDNDEGSGRESDNGMYSERPADDKVVMPITPEALAAFNAAQERTGVVYISRIPPGMRPTKVRHLMSAYGEIGRVYLQQEGANPFSLNFFFYFENN